MATVKSETIEGVRIVSLNRPERHNAIDDAMFDEVTEALHEAVHDETSRAILLRGEGKSFCSGRDVTVLGHRARSESDFHFIRSHQMTRVLVLDCPKPVVAALKGAVVGGGFELALSADVRVAASDARMSLPEINYGLLPDTGGSQLLASLVGRSRAKYMVLGGERIDAATALAWGAVDFVVEPEALDERAFAVARNFAGKPPIALAMGKQMIDQMQMGAIRAGLGQELLAQSALFRTDDYQEAKAARREQREPRYQGR